MRVLQHDSAGTQTISKVFSRTSGRTRVQLGALWTITSETRTR